MATVEEFLVSLKIDPASVVRLENEIKKAAEKASDTTIEIPVESNADEVLDGIDDGLKQATKSTQNFSKEFETQLQRADAAANELRGTLVAIGAVGALALGQGFRLAAQESRNLADANVILRQSQEQLVETQKQLRVVADEVGLSYQAVTSALFDVASAGIVGQEAIDVVSTAARVAQGNNIDLTIAFNGIATAMNVFGLAADAAADKLVAIGQATRGTVEDVAEVIGRVGSLASEFGIGIDTLGAAFATLTNKGIPAALAITGVQQTIRSFIRPAGEAVQMFKDMGITIGGTAFQTQSLAEKFELLRQAQARGVDISKMFPAEVLANISALLGSLDLLDKNMKTIAMSAGATGRALEATFLSPAKELDRLFARIGDLLTLIGDELLSAIAPVIRLTSDFIGQNIKLTAVILGVTLGAAGLVAVLGGLVFVNKTLTALYTFVNAKLAANALLAKGATVATVELTVAQRIQAGVMTRITVVTNALSAAAVTLRGVLLTEIGVLATSTIAWLANAAARAKAFVAAIPGTILLVVGAVTALTVATITNTVATITLAGVWKGLIGLLVAAKAGIIAVATSTIVLNAALAIGLVGAIALAIFGLIKLVDHLLGYSKAVEDAKKASADLDLTTRRLRRSVSENADQQKVYNRLIGQGVNEFAALKLAVDTYGETLFLISKGLKRTADDEERLLVLLRKHPELQDEAAKGDIAALKATDALRLQKARLNVGEKDLLKTIEDVTKAAIKLREGQATVDIRTATVAAEKRSKILEESAAQEQQLITSLNTARRAASGSALAEIEGDLVTHKANLADINQAIVDNRFTVSTRIVQIAEAEAQSQIQAARTAADQRISLEKKAADAITKEIARIANARQSADARAASFVERALQATLRRSDVRLAELRTLQLEGAEALKNAATEERRAQVLEAIKQRVEGILASSTKETQARKELVQIEGRLKTARDQEQANALLEEGKLKIQEIQKEEAKTAEIRRLSNALLEEASEVSIEAAKAITEEELKLEDLQDERSANLQVIADTEAEFEERQKAINAELVKRNQLAEKFNQTELKNIAAAAALATVVSGGAATIPEAGAGAGAGAPAGAGEQTLVALNTQVTGLNALVAQLSASLVAAQATFSNITTRISDVLTAQGKFTEALVQFGDVVVEKLTSLNIGYTNLSTRFDALTEQVAALKTPGVKEDLASTGL